MVTVKCQLPFLPHPGQPMPLTTDTGQLPYLLSNKRALDQNPSGLQGI